MLESNIGEYQTRLEMLNILNNYMGLKMKFEGDENRIWQKSKNIIMNLYHYYSQFKDVVKDRLKTSKKEIEKDLKGFIKIASWKDINSFALKESAMKTHRQLKKFLRKYQTDFTRGSTRKIDQIEILLFNSEWFTFGK